MTARRRVVVVTGGGAGIGAAVAEAIGRTGAHVVTMDPLVSLDGTEQLPPPEETTAGRIVAAGGSAEASATSVTDREVVRDLFERLAAERGALDAVVNVAGISRPTGFAKGSDDDWLGVLSVHLDGYLNVLGAALPLMAAAGHGHIVGVTSGSGWRAADAGAYSCAKRAVAALTWQLGPVAPAGVIVNAMSPIAVTRMVTAALGRAAPPTAGPGGAPTGGLSLGSMPAPEQLGPLGARLIDESFTWCRGRVVFAGGSEAAIIDPPRLLEVVRVDDAKSLPHLLAAMTPIWATVEAQQVSTGGSNPRLTVVDHDELPVTAVRSCAVIADDASVRATLTQALAARDVACTTALADDTDAVIVALAGGSPAVAATAGDGWERVLVEHDGIVGRIQADASWARATAAHAGAVGRPVRLVTLTDATTSAGRSRGQASAQLARAARGATGDRVSAFAIAVESATAEDTYAAAELATHLVTHPEAEALSGGELVAGAGWLGLRSHPRPTGSITYGGPELPSWFDAALRSVVGPS